jgi:hypothetical protein
MNRLKQIFSLSILLFFISGCSLTWTEAIQRGQITNTSFSDNLSVDIAHDLVIVPVVLNGKEFRFLFDTGAPLSISENLQKEMGYKIISTGHIVDSGNNRTKVNWAQVDTLLIGNTKFTNQTAFVADFDANPILKCLDVDGIVGSNLIRFCNWKINFENEEITLSDQPVSSNENTLAVVSFNTDDQFDILLDMQIDNADVKNVKLDYGSNGSISISSSDFEELKQDKVLEKTFSETGFSRTGITGKVNEINREIALLNEVSFGGLTIDRVYIKSGKSGLIGTKVLSRYAVTIDSKNHKLYFGKSQSADKQLETFGLIIGISPNGALYIQSVIEGSVAAENEVLPNMRVLKIDSIDFSENADFCTYMEFVEFDANTMDLKLEDKHGSIKNVSLVKRGLKYRTSD